MNKVARIVDFDDKTFNPFGMDDLVYGDIEDLGSRVAALHAKGPVHEGEMIALIGWKANPLMEGAPHYSVIGFEESMQVDGDATTFAIANDTTVGTTYGKTVSVLDPPVHTAIRKVFQKAFLPNIVAKWGDLLVAPVANGLIDKFIERGEADLVEDFAIKYPFEIIFRQLALPLEDIATFHKLAATLSHCFGDYVLLAQEASRKLGAYFTDMIAERRKRPGEDMVSLLINAEVDGERLDDEYIISFLRQLVNAAGDTTYRGMGILLIGLLRDPKQLDAVRNDRALVSQAIDEMLRWDSPVCQHSRIATRDVVVGGVAIPKGAVVDNYIWAANRDPKVFPDPDHFDITRTIKRHMAFGYGPHMCLGKHLARLEITRGLNAILDRLPNLRFNPDKPAPTVVGAYFRTPRNVHVKFG